MFVDWLLASFHHLAVFSLAAILSAEIVLTSGPIDDRMALRVARIDAWFGIVAAIVVAAGVLRVFFGAKGYEYYYANIFFWAKMALFVGVGLVSVAPTMMYMVWRRRVRANPTFRPPAEEVAQLRQAMADHPVQASVQGRLDRVMAHVEARLGEAPYLAGRESTAADIMSVFSLTTMRLFQPVDLAPHPNILAYLQRIGERPAYRRAMAKGDPDLTPKLS